MIFQLTFLCTYLLSAYGANIRSLYSAPTRSFNNSWVHKKDDPDGREKDDFGRSVAVQNGVALVGSPEDDDSIVAFDSGRVFVFLENNDVTKNWQLIREIEDGEPGDYFGWAVAMHTDFYAVVGACRDDLYGDFSGGAYFVQIETNPYADQDWPTRIVQSERHGTAFFGYSVAMSEGVDGNLRVAIGAYGHRGKGAVFIYTRQLDNTLGNEQILYGADSVYGDKFGWSVSILGDIVAVGAPLDERQGSVYVFTKTATDEWAQTNKIMQKYGDDDQKNPLLEDFFGMAVALCDGFLTISAPHNDVRGYDAGAVFVYQQEGATARSRSRRVLSEYLNDYISGDLVENALDLFYGKKVSRNLQSVNYVFTQTIFSPSAKARGRFGWSMAYDPVYGRLLVGSDASETQKSGNAFIYTIVDDFFELETSLSPTKNEDDDYGEEKDANFGVAVAIHGDYIAVGANRGHGESTRTGDVYFFRALTYREFMGYSDAVTQSISTETAAGLGAAMGAVGCIVLVFLILFFRYRAKGDNEGFFTYLTDSMSDTMGSMSASSGTHKPLQFLDEDDSQHSTHPMIDDASNKMKSSSSDRLSASEGAGSRDNKKVIKASTGTKSPGSYPAKASKSRVQLAGMNQGNAKRQNYAQANLSDL